MARTNGSCTQGSIFGFSCVTETGHPSDSLSDGTLCGHKEKFLRMSLHFFWVRYIVRYDI